MQCGTGAVRPVAPHGNFQRFAHSGHYALLPYCEQAPLYEQHVAVNWNSWENNNAARRAANEAKVPYLNCPSSAAPDEPTNAARTRGLSNYGFCAGDNYAAGQTFNGTTQERDNDALSAAKREIRNRGVYGRSWPTIAEVTDGTSNTIGIAEFIRPNQIQSLGMVILLAGDPNATPPLGCKAQWTGRGFVPSAVIHTQDTARGFRAWAGNPYFNGVTTILPPNSPNCMVWTAVSNPHWMGGIYSAGSLHTGGAQVGLVDGSVQFVSSNIDAGNPGVIAPLANGGGISPYGVWGAMGTKGSGEVASLNQ
jgi:hypothetical protein